MERIRGFPPAVKDEIGFALYQAQIGGKHVNAKPLKGLGSGVLEVVSDYRGDTFRAVYIVRLASRIYVYMLSRKSQRPELPPRAEIDLIKNRLKRAVELHSEQGN